MGWIVKLDGKGRFSVPVEVRNKLGLKRVMRLDLNSRIASLC